MKNNTKSTGRKVAKKKSVFADTFPHVIVVHEGDPECPLSKLSTPATPMGKFVADVFMVGLRLKYSVKVRKFTSNGIEIK